MTPERAHSYGVRADDVRITTTARRHGGQWVVWIVNESRPNGEQVLYTTASPFAATQWRARLARLEAAGKSA